MSITALLASVVNPMVRAQDIPYKDPQAAVDSRIDDLIGRLTAEEKIELLGGNQFTLKGNKRLGIPAFVTGDASMGIRNYGKSTAYANGVGLACTWDVILAKKVGIALGRDCRARGVHILLAPGMNLYRSPMCGRNFEYLGEDPLLAGNIAAQMIQGVQSQQVAVTAKHFVANEQEANRHLISSDVDERTLRELYLKPFEIAVKNGAWGVMSSYNPVNGVHTSQNDWLLNKILKHEWGFLGFVMSDWESCYEAEDLANGGLDIEMPSGRFFNAAYLLPLINEGKVLQSVIDDKVRRQLRVAFTLGWFDRPQVDPSIPKDDPASDALALQGARESVTLLKNEDALLPLDRAKMKKIVILGHNADPAVTGGGGSAFVEAFHSVSVFQGVRNLVDPGVKVILVPWKRSSTVTGSSESGGKDRPEALDANGAEGTPPIPAEYIEDVKTADAVIVCVGFSQSPPKYRDADPKKFDQEGEGGDRPYSLPPGQQEVIRAAVKLNPKTIVILNAGGSVATKGWINKVPAFLDAFYPGQNGGTAIAEILFGLTNPSGKLAFSWENQWEDSAAYGNYPFRKKDEPYKNYEARILCWPEIRKAYPESKANKISYSEGLFLGYRWFDHKKIKPLFPFGFGLSYTTFTYSDLKLNAGNNGSYTATAMIKNTGSRAGAEIVQLYIQPPKIDVPRPVRELKGFTRIELAPNESREVRISFNRQDLAYWNQASKSWTVTPGEYDVLVGASSAKLNLHAKLLVQ
ncbi:MAG: glycoside hydrolase family 3 C-terminal domain-containing protein [Verrucomicrobiota bacterium]